MLTATVQFCGAGGTSEGARQAGIHVEAAINHSTIAIASHEANHKGCKHYQQAIEEIDPDDMPDSDLLLTSPCCTNHTGAKGQKRYHQDRDLYGDIVFNPLDEKSRNTMEDVVRFAKAKLHAGNPYKIIVVENVTEVIKWHKYPTWLASLTALGYQHQNLYWNSRFFGVPQSRDRAYIVFWLRDLPAPDLEHRPPTYCVYCERTIQAVQSWKTWFKWGNYQEQYTYNCPQCAREVTPPSIPAHAILNVNDLGRPIGNRIVENIQVKIAKGMQRLPDQQFLYGYYNNPVYRHLDKPVGAVARWALITPDRRFEDTLHRMLSPLEVKLSMGFVADYQILGTVTDQIWQLGNAVCPPIMEDILKRCVVAIAPVEGQQAA